MTFLQRRGFKEPITGWWIAAEGELGGTVLNTQKLRNVCEVGGNSSWIKGLKKYPYKSINYLQFKIISCWTLQMLKALESELNASLLICHESCIWNLKPYTPAHLVCVNVTISHFLQVEDEYEKLQLLKLLSVSESTFEKNMSHHIFISLPLLLSLN